MTSHSDGYRFYINEFDDSIDAIMLDIISAVQAGYTSVPRLEFWINSEGGDAKRAFALVELMRLADSRGKQVHTFVLSEAFSAGSIVAVAGTKGLRRVARGAFYMLHYGEVELVGTSPVSIERMAKANITHFNQLEEHYKKYTSIEDINEELKSDYFYIDAATAVEFGLADGFIDQKE